ncbi:MAG TPA: NDP-sugar synthase [Pyrinomonadaceae bacterium]|jgi:NDP-sugar pyrophosphorylase family protein|nr:NDP-sugar synthase [Pyrinomonadaceae bacterium]
MMRAMILAAGYGTRLWPLTEDRTKPAIPFLGRPLVGYVAEYLGRYGFREVVVNLHHRPESVRASLGDGSRFGVHLEYIEEPVILGTSGALDNARHLLYGDPFVVINGKIITDIDLSEALETHRKMNALATLVLRPNPARERFSIVETDDGLIKGFGGMPTPPAASDNVPDQRNVSEAGEAPLMFTGIQILDSRIFDYIPRGVFSHSTTDVYPQAIEAGELVVAHVANGSWYELSTIPRYLEISLALLAEQGRDLDAGSGCRISDEADVHEALLWNEVTVDAGARVRRSILGDGVRVGAGEVIEDAAVVRAALVCEKEPPPKALKGEVRGDNFVVPLRQ